MVGVVVDMVSMSPKTSVGFTELTVRTGLPAQTLRRYAKEFSRWLPTRKVGRVVQFQADAVEVIEAIRSAFEQGLTTPQVRDLLVSHAPPVIELSPDSPAEDTKPTTIPTTSPMAMDPATLAALLPMVDRWLTVQERQVDLMGRAVAALESLATRLPLSSEQPQNESKARKQPEGHANAQEGQNEACIASPSLRSRADILAEVARLRSVGMGSRAIASAMTRAGWPTLSGRGRWAAGAVKRILKGETK